MPKRVNKLITKIAKFCCDRQLLARSANLVIFSFGFVCKTILVRLFSASLPPAPRGKLPPLLPLSYSYLYFTTQNKVKKKQRNLSKRNKQKKLTRLGYYILNTRDIINRV